MDQERRNSESTDRKIGVRIQMLIVIINEPHDVQVRLEVDTTVIQCGDAGELNRRTIRLYYASA